MSRESHQSGDGRMLISVEPIAENAPLPRSIRVTNTDAGIIKPQGPGTFAADHEPRVVPTALVAALLLLLVLLVAITIGALV